ncbi:MAG: metal ABC transporter permease [Candidatus Thorarchaeota archaeon]|nr:MAG: metal ABC transporter permease [Candidatus Thorarchaeota archaeon]
MIQDLIAMIDVIQIIIESPFLQRAILGAILIAIIAAASGTFLVFRGLSFMASGVAHAALGGTALGIFLQDSGLVPWFDPIFGALLFSVLVAAFTGYAGESGITQKMEVAVGVSFALSMSFAVFLMYYIPPYQVPQIWGYLIGDILLLNNLDIIMLGSATLLLAVITLMFNKEFVYVSVDMEGSTAHGMNARAYHYLMLIVSALAIALATKAVGAILVYAIMVAPAAASNELVKSVRGVIFSVFLIALIAELAGIATSFVVFVSPSAIAGILAALSYILALQIKRVKERVDVDIDDPELYPDDLKVTRPQPTTHEHEDGPEH